MKCERELGLEEEWEEEGLERERERKVRVLWRK